MLISPLKNSNLFGHSEAKKFFLKAFQEKRMPQSWLITGLKGIGKATLAYHFTKFLLQHPLHHPTSLESITGNSTIKKIEALTHPDFLLIDAEVINNEIRKQPIISVDEIREVTKFLRLTPSESDYRIVVIDGGEYMNNSAANALLKILEEPPQNSFIFLISQSPFKLLPTIRSRCINLKLNPLNLEEFSQALTTVMPEQPYEIEKLYGFTEGNLKLAVTIYQKFGKNFDENITSLMKEGSINNILKFVENIKSQHGEWTLLRYIILKAKIQNIKGSLNDTNCDLEKEIDCFFDLQNKLLEAETLYLEKQHLILTTL